MKADELTREQLLEVLETACRLINQGLDMGKDWGQISEDEMWTPDAVAEEWENVRNSTLEEEEPAEVPNLLGDCHSPREVSDEY